MLGPTPPARAARPLGSASTSDLSIDPLRGSWRALARNLIFGQSSISLLHMLIVELTFVTVGLKIGQRVLIGFNRAGFKGLF